MELYRIFVFILPKQETNNKFNVPEEHLSSFFWGEFLKNYINPPYMV